ncbi:MAG TPA: response regulator [Chloroflexota bacterium]
MAQVHGETPHQPSGPRRTRVAIIALNHLACTVLAKTLEARCYDVVATTTSGWEGLQLVAKTRPDIVVLGLDLPDRDPFALCREILYQVPTTKVLIIDTELSGVRVFEAINAGASGYTTYKWDLEKFLENVDALAEGRTLFDTDALEIAKRWLHLRPPNDS